MNLDHQLFFEKKLKEIEILLREHNEITERKHSTILVAERNIRNLILLLQSSPLIERISPEVLEQILGDCSE